MDRESLRSQPVIYVGVLDLRVRRRTLLQNGLLLDTARDSLTAYCVLRLGDQHHRTPSFPPEGLEEVPVRRTIVDDKRCEEGDMQLTVVQNFKYIDVLYCTSSTVRTK